MTTIIAVQNSSRALFGADSLIAGAGRNYYHNDTVKVIEKAGYLIGCAGDLRALQVVIHTWTPPAHPRSTGNLLNFVISKVVPSLKDTFTKQGLDLSKTGDEKVTIEILIALRGEIFEIDREFSVTRDSKGFYGIGSGGDYGLAALHAGAEPHRALEIAELLNNGTRRPFIFIEQTKPTKEQQ